MRRFKSFFLFLLALPMLFLSACQKESGRTVVRVGDLPVVSALPFYVALEEGYFESLDIEIEKIKLENPNLIIDALLAGNIDMSSTSGAMGIAGIAMQKNPNQLQIYAGAGGLRSVPTEALFASNDSQVNGFEDLEGKKLGILPGIQWRTIATHLLKSSGLDPKSVQLVELAPSLQPTALSSSQVDALLAIEHMASIIRIQGLGKEIYFNPSRDHISNPFYPGAGIIRTEFVEENPILAAQLMLALQKGINFINQNPNQARQYLVDHTSLTPGLAAEVNLVDHKMAAQFNQADREGIQAFWDLFYEYEVVDSPIDSNNAFYTPIS